MSLLLLLRTRIGGTVIVPEVPKLYPLAGITQSLPLTGAAQTYPLAGQTQTYPIG